MEGHAKQIWSGWSRPIAAAAVFLVLMTVRPPRAKAQTAQASAAPAAKPQSLEAMEAAGVKMSFDVVSVKPNNSDQPKQSNVSLSPGAEVSLPTGGLFSATNYSLVAYIAFAYNFSATEIGKLLPQMPKDKKLGRYDIEARAQGNPAKDQLRLMMQSLLQDRFKLVFHTETKQGPIYALVLTKPGKLGPHLQQHTDDASCSSGQPASDGVEVAPGPASAQLPSLPCGIISRLPASAPGLTRFGGRAISLTALAMYTSADRPVIDQTGLSGTFDFDCEIGPRSTELPPPDSEPQPQGLTFREAMQDQLGLKLEPQTGPVTTCVLDHIEQPSTN